MLSDTRVENARPAAVLVVLEGDNEPRNGPNVVLTERRDDLPSHPGQISFPGGRQEPEELLLETALREASEEIGLARTDVQILGQLSPLFVPPSNYLVYPFVAFSMEPLTLAPADGEVRSIIRAPLSALLDPANRRTEDRERYGKTVRIPLFDIAGSKVWGATAMMLAELIDLIETD